MGLRRSHAEPSHRAQSMGPRPNSVPASQEPRKGLAASKGVRRNSPRSSINSSPCAAQPRGAATCAGRLKAFAAQAAPRSRSKNARRGQLHRALCLAKEKRSTAHLRPRTSRRACDAPPQRIARHQRTRPLRRRWRRLSSARHRGARLDALAAKRRRRARRVHLAVAVRHVIDHDDAFTQTIRRIRNDRHANNVILTARGCWRRIRSRGHRVKKKTIQCTLRSARARLVFFF